MSIEGLFLINEQRGNSRVWLHRQKTLGYNVTLTCLFVQECLQKAVRQNRTACLLEWRSSHLQLPRVLVCITGSPDAL